MPDLYINWVPKEKIIERYSRIKPVVKKDGQLYWLRKLNENELYEGIGDLQDDDAQKAVKENEIIPITDKDFRCLHEYTYYGVFRPSVAEVLTQIDPEVLDKVKAFEIIEKPRTVEDFCKDDFAANAFDSGHHVSTVRLYKSAS